MKYIKALALACMLAVAPISSAFAADPCGNGTLEQLIGDSAALKVPLTILSGSDFQEFARNVVNLTGGMPPVEYYSMAFIMPKTTAPNTDAVAVKMFNVDGCLVGSGDFAAGLIRQGMGVEA